ncbi:MAG: endolytic transglycosylase MltG [Ruminococcus sp.]|nr:endolytic transglycosylase MltG [Ruminococcus sp.]
MNDNMDKRNDANRDEVNRYRQQRVEQFKLNISDNTGELPKAQVNSDFSDEITSFSDETTKAQIERASKKELRRQKREEKKVEKIKASRNKKVFRLAWIVLVALVTVVITQFLITGCNDFLAIKRKDTAVATIRIKTEDSVSDIAKQLEDKGVIDSKTFFTVFAKITGKLDGVTPGIYHLSKDKDYLGILNHLQFTGNVQSTIEVVVTEGTNILELVDTLYSAGVTHADDREEFLRLLNSNEFDEEYPFLKEIEDDSDREYRLEGYMFPDTYQFYIDEAPEITIKRFLDNFYTRVYEYEYEIEGYDEPVTLYQVMQDNDGYTLDEYVNMASIVQAEAANDEDMFGVSSVIHNRLEYGPQYDIHTLGMDSTIFYPYKNRDAVPDDIIDNFESVYDTYKHEGLPPSAICSPSLNALIAAAVPEDSNYLYFCHSADGQSYYAATFSEHQSNLSKAGLD